MADKLVSAEQVLGVAQSAKTLGLGGSALSRRPMWLARRLADAGADGLNLVTTIGGPDVDLLVGKGRVATLQAAYVGLEALGLAPHFRRARQEGRLDFVEWSEHTLLCAFRAAAERLPFYPTHSALASDILKDHPDWVQLAAPYTGEPILAIPPLAPDVAVIHVQAADRLGHGVICGDRHADLSLARASRRVYLSAERVMETEELWRLAKSTGEGVSFLPQDVAGVAEVPGGAAFTACFGSYPVDLAAAAAYLREAS